MHLARIQSLLDHGVSLDTETFVMVPGNLCPPLVAGSAGWYCDGSVHGAFLPREQAIQAFLDALRDPSTIIVTANGPYDLAVLVVELEHIGFDVLPLIFEAFEQQRIYDIQTAEALHAIANGHLGKDPRTGGALMNPDTGRKGQYSLAMCVSLTLGRDDSKANDEFRLRYHELADIPPEQWPPAARDYPVDDARNTLQVALAQCGFLPKTAVHHLWGTFTREDGTEYTACTACGATKVSATCVRREPHRNLLQVADQTYSAFCLHLGAVWGFHVDQKAVDTIEGYALRRRAKLIQPFIDAGIITHDADGYHENQSVLKRMVAIAYGATEPCPHCKGTGKIPSPTAKPVRCGDCRGACLPTAKPGPKCNAWRAAHAIPQVPGAALGAPGALPWWCGVCSNTGLVPNPNPKMINCVLKGAKRSADEDAGEDDAESEGDTKTCDGTGFVLPVGVPKTDKGGVGKGRDPLIESGDEFLMSLGSYLEDAKVLKDYVPWLRRGRACVECCQPGTEKRPHISTCGTAARFTRVGDDGVPVVEVPAENYRDIALTLRPNTPLETERVSYIDGYVQLLPRAPGFKDNEPGGTGEYIPSLRECITARGPRYEIVEVPEDYVLQEGESYAE